MFCNHCGNQMPEGTAFCPACGAQAQQTQQAYYQQPQYQQPQYQQPQYQQPQAPVKKSGVPITVTFIISVLLIIASILSPLVTSLFDVPLVSFAFEVLDEEAEEKELMDELEYGLDNAKAEYKQIKGDLSSKEKKQYENVMDKLEKVVDNFSLLNINAFVRAAEKLDEEYDFNSMDDAMEGYNTVMGIVIGGAIGAFVLPLVFALLGGLKKSAGLTVAALIFTAISQVILSGFLLLALSAVVYIVQIVLCGKYKKA